MKKMSLVALACAVALSGCYGPFRLTKKLYDWNGTVGTKWVNEGVFLAFAIIPVYEFSALGDAVIFNSIEFWGGKNPIAAKSVKSLQSGDEQAVLNYDPASKRLRVDEFKGGRIARTVVFEPGDGGMVARDANGEILMRATTLDNGRVALTDAEGNRVATYDPSQL